LPDMEDLAVVRCVCRRWQAIVDRPFHRLLPPYVLTINDLFIRKFVGVPDNVYAGGKWHQGAHFTFETERSHEESDDTFVLPDDVTLYLVHVAADGTTTRLVKSPNLNRTLRRILDAYKRRPELFLDITLAHNSAS